MVETFVISLLVDESSDLFMGLFGNFKFVLGGRVLRKERNELTLLA